jgi:hypothetical protein
VVPCAPTDVPNPISLRLVLLHGVLYMCKILSCGKLKERLSTWAGEGLNIRLLN